MADGLSLLVKPVSADCNMRCRYCFYIRPDDPYQSDYSHMMDDDTLRAMIAGYMKWTGRIASFGWQGGEPLLAGIDFYKRVVNYQQIYGKPGQLVSNNIQTNGTLLQDSWAEFFARYRFFVGVSLDGPEEYHNYYRRSLDGANSFKRTMAGIESLRKYGVDLGILTVVSDVIASKAEELYEFFTANGFRILQFIPCVEFKKQGNTDDLESYSVKPKDYGKFLCTLFDLWYAKGVPGVSIRFFENILAIYIGIEPEMCAFDDKCSRYLVIEYNGDVYPCDFFVKKQWFCGNIVKESFERIVESYKVRVFKERKGEGAEACNKCKWNFICHCGCQHYRLRNGQNYLCEGLRDFFDYTEKRFAILRNKILKRTGEGFIRSLIG